MAAGDRQANACTWHASPVLGLQASLYVIAGKFSHAMVISGRQCTGLDSLELGAWLIRVQGRGSTPCWQTWLIAQRDDCGVGMVQCMLHLFLAGPPLLGWS